MAKREDRYVQNLGKQTLIFNGGDKDENRYTVEAGSTVFIKKLDVEHPVVVGLLRERKIKVNKTEPKKTDDTENSKNKAALSDAETRVKQAKDEHTKAVNVLKKDESDENKKAVADAENAVKVAETAFEQLKSSLS